MTDIHGDPDPHIIEVPVHLYCPRPIPFPGLCLIVSLYGLFAFLYVAGLVSIFPRTGGHDATLAAAFALTCIAWTLWPSVKRIPTIGRVIYYLPVLTLIPIPFALDFYLMFRR